MVKWLAVCGQQTTVCKRSGECPHASSAPRTMAEKNCEDQAVFSEALTMRADPVNNVDIAGEIRLWNG